MLRAISINAPVNMVRDYALASAKDPQISNDQITFQDGTGQLLLFLQPVDAHKTILRGVLTQRPTDEIAVLRRHNLAMTQLRDRIEADAATQVLPAPLEVPLAPVAAELSGMPVQAEPGPDTSLRVQVTRKWVAGRDVMAFRLTALRGQLPTFQPGAHIDVRLPNGMIRQYSLTNGPGETDHYTIGVKREVASRGGSDCLHDEVQSGDVLAISAPHNNFPLRRDAVRTVLIAGGIGITPLLAMAQTLRAQALPFTLHVFAQSAADLAFPQILDALGDSTVVSHFGLSPDQTGTTLASILHRYAPAHHVYICGPAPMMQSARDRAAQAGWPDEAVHFEYFKNTRKIDDGSGFDIALARSALTLHVPAGKTILQVLRDHGITAPSSCEQGACGACLTTVLEGTPDHQDVCLSASEQAANQKILTCVSRAKSSRLVLDI